MPSHRRNMPEQEHSIKERAHELFVEPPRPEVGAQPTKPFPAYLRETPAKPLSPLTKTLFWIVGIIVAVLFLAALWRITHRRGDAPRRKPDRPPAEVEDVLFPSRGRSTRLLTGVPARGSVRTQPASPLPFPIPSSSGAGRLQGGELVLGRTLQSAT